MHTPKCGGHSIRKVLDTRQINYIRTNDIDADSANEGFQVAMDPGRSKEHLIFGHSSAIKFPTTTKGKTRYKDLLEVLYNDYMLIMPARNPINLLRSWMYYQNKIANKFINENKIGRADLPNIKLVGKINEFINTMSQVCDLDTNFIDKFGFNINANNEIDYLMRYLKTIQTYKFLVPAWSHTLQLYFPVHRKILTLLKSEKQFRVIFKNEQTAENLLIYNCEQYSDIAREKINDKLGQGFAEELNTRRENKTLEKKLITNKISMDKFESLYKTRFQCEFDIFNYSI